MGIRSYPSRALSPNLFSFPAERNLEKERGWQSYFRVLLFAFLEDETEVEREIEKASI